MLFRKITLTPDTPKETPQTAKTPATGETPIYILGDTALAYFLAVKLTAAGNRIIIISHPKENTSLNTNGITVKEDYQLQKQHYRLETAHWLKEEPQALIIAASSSKIKSMLTCISKNKIKNTPVVSFSHLKDPQFVSDILGVPVTQAYFDGWLRHHNQLVTAYGRAPEITLCCETNSETYKCMEKIFAETHINLQNNNLPLQAFWKYFSVYAPCSLITTASGKSIFEITKNKQLRNDLSALLKEAVQLVPNSLSSYDSEDLLKQIFNIPTNYIFPLAEQVSKHQTGDFDFISSVIRDASLLNKCTLPETNKLLKKICEQLINQK